MSKPDIAQSGNGRLLLSVSRKIEVMVTRLGWKVVYRCNSQKWGTQYLRLALPGCERGRRPQACIRIADHPKPAGADEKRFDWILDQHRDKPFTELRAFLWGRLRDSLDKSTKMLRPRWRVPESMRFDVKGYLRAREAERCIKVQVVRVDRITPAAAETERDLVEV